MNNDTQSLAKKNRHLRQPASARKLMSLSNGSAGSSSHAKHPPWISTAIPTSRFGSMRSSSSSPDPTLLDALMTLVVRRVPLTRSCCDERRLLALMQCRASLSSPEDGGTSSTGGHSGVPAPDTDMPSPSEDLRTMGASLVELKGERAKLFRMDRSASASVGFCSCAASSSGFGSRWSSSAPMESTSSLPACDCVSFSALRFVLLFEPLRLHLRSSFVESVSCAPTSLRSSWMTLSCGRSSIHPLALVWYGKALFGLTWLEWGWSEERPLRPGATVPHRPSSIVAL